MHSKYILLGTSNPGKVRELSRIARVLGVNLISLGEYERSRRTEHHQPIPVVGEGGTRYEENALAKVLAYHRWSGEPVIADDTGLEIEEIYDLPGVYTAGVGVRHTCELLGEGRIARAKFISVLCFVERSASPKGYRVVYARGELEGRFIVPSISLIQGTRSLPFSPYFFPCGEHRSLEVLSQEAALEQQVDLHPRQFLSHRGRALTALLHSLS